MAHQSQSPRARVSLTRPLRNLALLAGIGSIVLGCSSSDNTGSTVGVGGSSGKATGGQGAGTGGSSASATGGSSAQSSSATGGASQGGTSQSATSTGGSNATGGTSAVSTTAAPTGGAATGGAGTGGATSVGGTSSSTGGASTTPGGSSATGGTATGGTAAGGATSSPVTPQMVSATDYRLTVGNVVLDINPQVGARVTSLKYSTTDIIKPYTCATYNGSDACNNSGSTFWTSPQSAWDGVVGGSNVWPPVVATDGGSYTPAINGTHLVLTGAADTTLGASVTKDISADAATGWITMAYTITATKAIQVAGWQITRVARGGIVFFPFTSLIGNSTPPWSLSTTGTAPTQTEWIDDTNQTTVVSSNGSKVIADGGNSGQTSTYLAYALGGNLLLLKYPNVASTAFAPSEGDTEVYPGSGYMELEAQGPYGSLAANATSTWTVQWRVVPIPSSVTIASGSATLLSFAQTQAGM